MSKLRSLDRRFAGRHVDRNVINLRVRWYRRYKLSLRDLIEIMAERGLDLRQAKTLSTKNSFLIFISITTVIFR